MTDEELKAYVPKYGDRILVRQMADREVKGASDCTVGQAIHAKAKKYDTERKRSSGKLFGNKNAKKRQKHFSWAGNIMTKKEPLAMKLRGTKL